MWGDLRRVLVRRPLPEDADATIRIRVGDSLASVEQRLILHTVSRCRTQDEAARVLGVSAKTLYNKLRLYEAQERISREGGAGVSTEPFAHES